MKYFSKKSLETIGIYCIRCLAYSYIILLLIFFFFYCCRAYSVDWADGADSSSCHFSTRKQIRFSSGALWVPHTRHGEVPHRYRQSGVKNTTWRSLQQTLFRLTLADIHNSENSYLGFSDSRTKCLFLPSFFNHIGK